MIKGILFSVLASVVFGILYLYSPLLTNLGLDANQVFGWRMWLTLPFILLFAHLTKELVYVKNIFLRIKQQPAFLLLLIVSSVLCTVQLWLFMYGAMNNRGLQVSLGYFLLPLVMALIGSVFLKEKLSKFQLVAIIFASIGVAHEIWRIGAIAWETSLVAFGYAGYFWLRNKMQTNNLGGFIWDLVLILPIATYFIGTTAWQYNLQNIDFISIIVGFGVLSAIGLGSYILASRLLSFTLFGLLSYLEPVFLALASLILGESIAHDEWFTYIPIWLAVGVLALEGIVSLQQNKKIKHQ